MNYKALAAVLCLALFGYGLLIAGIFILTNVGWALVAGSILPLFVSGIFLRGFLLRALHEPG